MTSNIRQKLALAAGIAFPVVATVATVLGCKNPAQAASVNFSWAGNEAYFVSGSFSYDDSVYSGTIGKEQLSSFNISFTKEGEGEQQYSDLSSLFDFEFDINSNSVKSMNAGAFPSYSPEYAQAPIGSLSFELLPKLDTSFGCHGLVWRKTADNQSVAIGRCDSSEDMVITPSEPESPMACH